MTASTSNSAAHIRPAPFKTFEGRTYGAGLSPETMPILARLGAGPMIFPYKSWQDTRDTLNTFKKSWQEHASWHDPAQAGAGGASLTSIRMPARRRMSPSIYRRVSADRSKHYDMGGENFAKQKGYEFYADNAAKFRDELEGKVEDFVHNSPWGTRSVSGEGESRSTVTSTWSVAHALRLFGHALPDGAGEYEVFCKAVLPELKKWDKGHSPSRGIFQRCRIARSLSRRLDIRLIT